MYLSVNDFVFVEIFETFEKRNKCIYQFFLWEKLFVKCPFPILDFNLHVWLPFGVEKTRTVEEGPQKIRMVKLLRGRLRAFYLEVVEGLFIITVDKEDVTRLEFSEDELFGCGFLEISHYYLFGLIYFLLILIH